MTLSPSALREHEVWMSAALEEAREAGRAGDVPVGAVVVRAGRIIARGRNRREARGSALGHAELDAIAGACRAAGDWRLMGCTLYVTLEPCCMCAGACLNARLDRVVYGAADKAAGCLGSRMNLFAMDLGPPAPGIVSGVLEEECAALLRDFFAGRRGGPAAPPCTAPGGPYMGAGRR